MTKIIDPATGVLMANGNKYIIHASMPVGRYSVFEKFQIQCMDDRDPLTYLQDLSSVWNLLNGGKLGEAAVKLYNVMQGIERVINLDPHPFLWICTCFIVKEGTDLKRWDEGEARSSIQDWIEEGYDIRDFFGLARDFVSNFMGDSRNNSESTLEKDKSPEQ
jgi:hypothetical protein